ncbi:hypothetical protein G7Y89_g14509 [Cudoniella acicularis]|uniref:2EXR domain-containing protein n=1 Tax=Cudoniella acicularis TaxID=354080 RepID=A0A8H4R3S3_9HELO|nr:hypothetical protein G7Y89_g14509 [Cudoniella acicularis]
MQLPPISSLLPLSSVAPSSLIRPSSPPTTFYPFLRLPVEVQSLIWLLVPSRVSVRQADFFVLRQDENDSPLVKQTHRTRPWAIVPSVLHDLNTPPGQVITISVVNIEKPLPMLKSTTSKSTNRQLILHRQLMEKVEKFHGEYFIPANLHANREARARALKKYKITFAENFVYPIVFDPARDMLYFESVSTVTTFKYFKWSDESLEIMKEAQLLAIGGRIGTWFAAHCKGKSIKETGLTKFENLKTMILERNEQSEILAENIASIEKKAIANVTRAWKELRGKQVGEAKLVTEPPFKSIFGGLVVPPPELELTDHGSDDSDSDSEGEDQDDKEATSQKPAMDLPDIRFVSKAEMKAQGMGYIDCTCDDER